MEADAHGSQTARKEVRNLGLKEVRNLRLKEVRNLGFKEVRNLRLKEVRNPQSLTTRVTDCQSCA